MEIAAAVLLHVGRMAAGGGCAGRQTVAMIGVGALTLLIVARGRGPAAFPRLARPYRCGWRAALLHAAPANRSAADDYTMAAITLLIVSQPWRPFRYCRGMCLQSECRSKVCTFSPAVVESSVHSGAQ